jgi:hypothetical protein
MSFQPPPPAPASITRRILQMAFFGGVIALTIWGFTVFTKQAAQTAAQTEQIERKIKVLTANAWDIGTFGVEGMGLKMVTPVAEADRDDLLWVTTKLKAKLSGLVPDLRVVPVGGDAYEGYLIGAGGDPVLILRYRIDWGTFEVAFLGSVVPGPPLPESPRRKALREAAAAETAPEK